MSSGADTTPDFLRDLAYLPRVTRRDGRAIDEALSQPNLFEPGVRLQGAIVEATYAASPTAPLKRLREAHVPLLIETQSLRFAGQRFLQVEQLRALPYAPSSQITADGFSASRAFDLANRALDFVQPKSVGAYLSPALPLRDDDLLTWVGHNDRLLAASCAANGGEHADRKPLIAHVAPGPKAIANAKIVVNRLLDHPIDGVYVEALRLDPVKDGPDKLIRFINFLMELKSVGVPIMVARVGAFGLVLQALGINGFDSGLGQAEKADLAGLNRPVPETDASRRTSGGPQRVYFEALKTTLQGPHVQAILSSPTLRGHFMCTLGCCRHRGFEDLATRARPHYLYVRQDEVDRVRQRPTLELRRDLVHESLRDAREVGRTVRRVIKAAGGDPPPSFDHIDRWIGLLAREATLRKAG